MQPSREHVYDWLTAIHNDQYADPHAWSFWNLNHQHIAREAQATSARLHDRGVHVAELTPGDSTRYTVVAVDTQTINSIIKPSPHQRYTIAFTNHIDRGLTEHGLNQHSHRPDDTHINHLTGDTPLAHTRTVAWLYLSYLTRFRCGAGLPWIDTRKANAA